MHIYPTLRINPTYSGPRLPIHKFTLIIRGIFFTHATRATTHPRIHAHKRDPATHTSSVLWISAPLLIRTSAISADFAR